MKFLRPIAIFFLLALSSCVTSKQDPLVSDAVPRVHGPFFVPVALSSKDCVNVKIGEQTVAMELDLGFTGDLTLSSQNVDRIAPKTFLSTKSMYGMRGTEYQSTLYRLPAIEIGAMGFTNPVLQVEGSEFIKESTLSTHNPISEHPGRLGWELFYNVNLLLNFKGGEIAFCDSLATLQQQGYFIKDFIAAPLHLERGLIELELTTPDGPLLCVLDTGATHNILNRSLEAHSSMEEAFWDPEHLIHYPSLAIGDRDFGPATFHQIPIDIPIHIDAILGMEFIREHLIFIDFEGRSIYIQAAGHD